MDKVLAGRRVLVVEDEMLVLIMIEDMLADLGCESVLAAASVHQALALIDAHTFDVAMLDMNLSGDKTYAVADALAAHGVPFVFSTGYSQHGMRDGYRDRPLLTKPFMEKELGDILARLLAPGSTGHVRSAS
ncbi:response regulator [Phreatobacter stygius]|uniref:Response regulator n=1 Tax=Phreatobacter stygius TaxID=1940610 RepID=A0A4D7B1J4_9HYPH|nr:response regulator [Phreatobacter stygius]QCI63376.1 response regulator [Phreatobacter stygius]